MLKPPSRWYQDLDACSQSSAGAKKAVTIGASTVDDERANFSNFSLGVDGFASGVNILSTWTGSDDAQHTDSGTSMTSPHTAGLLAYFLSIYPSDTFDPSIPSLIPAVEPDTQWPFAGSFTCLYSMSPRTT